LAAFFYCEIPYRAGKLISTDRPAFYGASYEGACHANLKFLTALEGLAAWRAFG
jgi:hypothetical protein